jgi:DNA invertase Pin-like site-specific DNA recombinase
MKQTIPVAILVRVSSSRQENARQIAELMQYANSKGYSVIETCRETISGAADADERHGLKQIEELAEAGKISEGAHT